MLGILNISEIEAVLHEQIVGRIGCHAAGTTYIVPISYAYDGESIYAITREGMKLDIMRENPKVCFEVDFMQDMANWKTVITWGVFEELKAPDERTKGLQLLVDRILPLNSSETTHLYSTWPFPSAKISEIKGIVFRIRLHEKSGRFENNSSTSNLVG